MLRMSYREFKKLYKNIPLAGVPKSAIPQDLQPNPLADYFLELLDEVGLPPPVEEHKFNALRKFKFDYAWIDKMIAVEIEGGLRMRGRHVRPEGYSRDCEKYSLAALMGWKVIRLTEIMYGNGAAYSLLVMAKNLYFKELKNGFIQRSDTDKLARGADCNPGRSDP